MKVNATYVSVWDGGTRIESNCKYNTETREVTNVGMVSVEKMDLEILDEEFVELPNGRIIKNFFCDGGIWENGQLVDD